MAASSFRGGAAEPTSVAEYVALARRQLTDRPMPADAVVTVKSGADALAALQKREVKHLVVRGTRINPTAFGEEIAKNLRLHALEFVDVELGDNGLRALLRGLASNTTLEVLRFDNTSVGRAGARVLGDFLAKNHSLLEVALVNDNIGLEGLRSIFDGLAKNSLLRAIDLSHDKIGLPPTTNVFTAIAKPASFHLLNALNKNRSLLTVTIVGNIFSADDKLQVAKAVKTSGRTITVNF